MSDSSQLILETDERGIAWLTLDRPEVHNAFGPELVGALSERLAELAADRDVRAVVLRGTGPSFSAGGDVQWMLRMREAGEAENERDALALAAMLRQLNFLPKPTVARIHGAALGGGVGLACCCDVAIAAHSARLGLSEVRLGLVPAVISPYVVDAIGARQARRLFQTAEILTGSEARDLGLVHRLVPDAELDTAVAQCLDQILAGGPASLAAAKALVFAVQGGRSEATQAKLDQATARLIARLRVSEEGQEGLGAFLDKRPPAWRRDGD